MPLRRPVIAAADVVRGFRADPSGVSAVVFALCALPMIGLVGLGIDYAQGLSYKRRLDAAADSAAIAAINGAQGYYNANVASESEPNLTSDAKAAGQTAGTKSFKVNAGNALSYVSTTPTVTVAKSGQTFTSSVSYTGPMKTNFGRLFGTPSFTIAGTTGSSLTMGTYLDFHILLDVSGSMGLPTSDAGQSALAAVNPDDRDSYPNGCVFACHFPGSRGYDTAKANKITLRVDSVASALNNLITTATRTRTLSSQFRIAVYPFIVHLMQAAALSSDFTTATTVANNLAGTYLDTGLSNSATKAMGSGGSHFDNLLPDLQTYVKTIGDGSTPQSPKAFVFIVTDGMNQSQTFDGSNWSAGGSTPGEPNFGYCQYAQSLGVVMSILYIPYVPIQNPNSSFAGNEDGKANAVIPKLPDDLKACASPGFFFTANSDTDISNAMQTMFAQAIKAARLTQ